jgi:hypothetical protein
MNGKQWSLRLKSSVVSALVVLTPGSVMAQDRAASVDLRVNVGEIGNETYEARTAIQVPTGHVIGDNLFPYEGIGWENEVIGYRLYLDERAVTDVFGKKVPDTVLDKVDYRSRYHDLADWGMDVMHVGGSTGIGGLGLYRGASLERFGKEGQLFAEVVQRSGPEVSFKIKHRNVPLADDTVGNVDATYSMKTGSPVTMVQVASTIQAGTLASGLAKAGEFTRIISKGPTKRGEWRYIAVWGDNRSEAKDGLGTVLFFRNGDAQLMPLANESYVIKFNKQRFTYGFGAVWEQGPMGISNREQFIAWADEQLKLLPQ